MSETPAALGYRMPAEWERHEATWLSWPKDPNTFPEGVLDKVEQVYVEMIETLEEGEKVNVLVDDKETEERVSRLLHSKGNVLFHRTRTADVWLRDYGPIFLKRGKTRETAITKWIFNAWGNKYDDLLYDNEAGMRVAESTGFRIFETGMVLEGGSIDVNGLGVCLTTKQCLLNRNRNPTLSKAEIETKLSDYLGAKDVIWLESGIEGDDTDGHVDDIARFVSEDTIICMLETNRNDQNYGPLNDNLELLRSIRRKDGRKFNVLPIQMPSRVDAPDGRLPASYANFYIGNTCVLVPVFDDPNDKNALRVLQDLFPSRSVVGINCRSLVWGLGAIHCVTQQQPL